MRPIFPLGRRGLIKLNVVVHGSKWLTFFTGMKRVRGKTVFTPGKERVKLNVVVHGKNG